MKKNNTSSSLLGIIYVYSGPGSCAVALRHTQNTLGEILQDRYKVHLIDAQDVKKGDWMSDAVLLIMPGGADILYARALKSNGNDRIRSFVHAGGHYLGLCAGAYYGCQRIVFGEGTSLEVAAERELAFFPDVGEGPTLKAWDHRSNSGAEAALLQWKGPGNVFPKDHFLTCYYNGGGHFVKAQMYPQVNVLATYASTAYSKAAIIEISVGKGRAILSGVHCEFDPVLFDETDPYLVPVQQKLLPQNSDRQTLMAYVLSRFNFEI